MHKVLHPRDDVDRLYVSRKERRRELTSIEDSVDALIKPYELWIGKHEGGHKKQDWQHDGQQNKNGKKNNTMGVLND